MINSLIQEMTKAVLSQEDEVDIRQTRFGTALRNELLFFFKPECFSSKSASAIQRLIEMSFQKLDRFEVEVAGVFVLSGRRLEQLGIMDRHYGFINRLSRTASQLVSPEKIAEFQDVLQDGNLRHCSILGGHEFLERYRDFDAQSLDRFWSTKKSVKVRSGFYLQKYEVGNDCVLLINGFHPLQLNHFIQPTHKIVVLLLHSNSNWGTLKNEMVGNTFPERAPEESIRGELFKRSKSYGIQNVSIANNCVHLSAGPFEAFFEIDNFFKNIPFTDYSLDRTNMFRIMIDAGLSRMDIENSLTNPVGRHDGVPSDLFTVTEDKDSLVALDFYLRYFTKREKMAPSI
jgi:hypothetical protein